MATHEVDVLVVGSGPAGATTARFAAEAGLRVLIVDKKSELGTPVECSGALSEHALDDGLVPVDEEYILAPVYGFVTYAAAGEQMRLDYRSYGRHQPLGYVVDRKRFDRYLSRLAMNAGVDLWLRARARSFVIEGGYVFAEIERFNQHETVRAKVVVGADGVMSQVGLWAGLRPAIKLGDMASCLQYIVDNVETEGLLEIVVGYANAPGGYAWVFPKGGGYAEVGLGVIRTMTDHDAAWHLRYFLEQSFMRDRFSKMNILEVQGGGVSLAAPLKRLVADHVLLVGDAGRHVNPLTGGGLHTALRGGRLAGEFLGRALHDGADGSAASLLPYQQHWYADQGDALTSLYNERISIFAAQDRSVQDARLYQTLGGYFHPSSPYRKV